MGIDIILNDYVIIQGINEGLSRELQFYLHAAALRTMASNSNLNEIEKELVLDRINRFLFLKENHNNYDRLIPKLFLPKRRLGYNKEWCENYILHESILRESLTPDELYEKYVDIENPINNVFVPTS